MLPVKGRTRIGFSIGRDITMANYLPLAYAGIHINKHLCYLNQAFILRLSIGLIIATLQLNTDTKIITVVAALKIRNPGVPGAHMKRHKLRHLSRPLNQKMSRHMHLAQLFKIRMEGAIELVAEECTDIAATIITGRQADVMQHQQINFTPIRALVAVRRRASAGRLQPAIDYPL